MSGGTEMIQEFFAQQRPHRGMTPDEYRRYMQAESDKALESAGAAQDDHTRYLPLNLARTRRIEKTYSPSSRVQAAARAIRDAQLWMVLTEPWCGDSAQNLPYIFKIAACNPLIDVRILLRDQNPDIMDAYLTHGARGIPILAAFDSQGRELFRWGPRPKPAAELFHRLKDEGIPVPELREQLHRWYAKNRGQALEDEFVAILTAV
jgi:hypothetical protein